MHVISEKMLREFWTVHPDAETPLRVWHRTAEQAEWESFAHVRETYAHADAVGRCVVFNIGGNKYRLVVIIHYNRAKVFVRHIMTHADYDRGTWKDDCCP